MTIKEIKDEYAKEQGFESWRDLTWGFKYDDVDIDEFLKHENAVIQLIQDELKKKMADEIDFIVSVDENSILNTENIK